MKGIVLAGGKGTRLYPTTMVVNKHFLPIYDKPMILYPVELLITLGISDIMIICNEEDLPQYQKLIDNNEEIKANIVYAVQECPRGIAEAFIIGEAFIGNDSVALVLGDNFLYNNNLSDVLRAPLTLVSGAYILGYKVKNPGAFAVVEINDEGEILSIEEKPDNPKSNLIATGIYFYDNDVVRIAKRIQPSDRNELEITSINDEYLRSGRLKLITLGADTIWWDLGTPDAIVLASQWMRDFKRKHSCNMNLSQDNNYRY